MNESYKQLIGINSLKYDSKSVLLIGAGKIAKNYVIALSNMGIKDITVITNSRINTHTFPNYSKIRFFYGGFEKNLPNMKNMDLTIIATPIQVLSKAANTAIDFGQKNILIEKPGSLHSGELSILMKKITSQTIRIAYNRLVYPNIHKLKQLIQKDGGISSCRFTFTEWIDKIPFSNLDSSVTGRWGISNSLHVISLVCDLIGFPKKLHTEQYGNIKWHKSGSIFVGSGISKQSIPFSYHADWKSSGRWSIEVFTEKNAYRLMPLEELYVCKKNTTEWKPVQFDSAFPNVKPGISEQIAIMLSPKLQAKIELVTIQEASEFIKIAEIFLGYRKLH